MKAVAAKRRIAVPKREPFETETILKARNLSNPYFIRAVASANPPKKRKIIGWAKEEKAALTSKIPRRTARTGIEREVTAKGSASVIQRTAANVRTASPFLISRGTDGIRRFKAIRKKAKIKIAERLISIPQVKLSTVDYN
jgi:hypothetical protein